MVELELMELDELEDIEELDIIEDELSLDPDIIEPMSPPPMDIISPPPPPPIFIPSIIFFIISSISKAPPPPIAGIPGIAGIPDIPPGPPELDVVEVEDAIFDEEKLEELEKDPSSLFVEVAIACEAEDESCLTAVLPSSVVKALEAEAMASWTSAPSGALILRGALIVKMPSDE